MLFIINFEMIKSTTMQVCELSKNDFATEVSTVEEYRDEQARELEGERSAGLPVQGLYMIAKLAMAATAMRSKVEGSETCWAMFEADGLMEAEIMARCVSIQFSQDCVAIARYNENGPISHGKLVGPNVSAFGGKFNKEFFVEML